ncbi:MAG: DUF885 family protein, partial [Candidatus Aminicenantes bacterium]|nr:DUF885 family protein [Candidatus Aminicenantes bacterium]
MFRHAISPLSLILIFLLISAGLACVSRDSAASNNGERLESFIAEYVAFRRGAEDDGPKAAEEWARRAEDFRSWEKRLEAIPRQGLTLDQDIDYRLILSDLRTETARIERERAWGKDPGLYLPQEGFDSPLKAENFSPEEKSRRLGEALAGIISRLEFGRANLKHPPVIFLDRAIKKAGEAAAFLRSDVAVRIEKTLGPSAGLGGDLENAASALEEYARFLDTVLRPQAVEQPGIGKDLYDYYLQETYLMNEDTESLLKKGEAYFAETLR